MDQYYLVVWILYFQQQQEHFVSTVTYFAAEASFDEEERYPQKVHPPLTVLQDTATQRQHKENATYPLLLLVRLVVYILSSRVHKYIPEYIEYINSCMPYSTRQLSYQSSMHTTMYHSSSQSTSTMYAYTTGVYVHSTTHVLEYGYQLVRGY